MKLFLKQKFVGGVDAAEKMRSKMCVCVSESERERERKALETRKRSC